MNNNQGKLIVIEGIDGSGKTTQIELLIKYLTEKNLPFEVISFPRYEDNLYGKLIRRYLEGEFGSIAEVNPYLMALAFAGDRTLARPLIESWLQAGKLVIANRYVSANKAHLAANLAEEKREEFMSWIDELEYQTNGLPKEDLNILLSVDPKIGQQNVKGEKGPVDLSSHKDIHENDLNHLNRAQNIYLELARAENNWQVVDCMVGNQMRPIQDIHQEITKKLLMWYYPENEYQS